MNVKKIFIIYKILFIFERIERVTGNNLKKESVVWPIIRWKTRHVLSSIDVRAQIKAELSLT